MGTGFVRKKKFLFLQVILMCCNAVVAQNAEIAALRDSLDAIQCPIPKMPVVEKWEVITIKTQKQWDNMGERMIEELKKGGRNIEFRLIGKGLVMSARPKTIFNLDYPDANIRIISKGATVVPEGITLKRCLRIQVFKSQNGSKFWVADYDQFDPNDIIVDASGKEIPLRGEMQEQTEQILKVNDNVWRMKTALPDLSEKECNDFYILLTQDWTSARHRVVKVNEGWLYFHLDSDDYHGMRNPNIDRELYGVNPRYCFINCPISNGLHIKEGKLYVPWKYKAISINKGGLLLHMGNCTFNSIEITGFKLNGFSKCPIGIYHSKFTTGLLIHHNTFTNLSSLAINTAWCENVVFCDNFIDGTRTNGVECGSKNTTICRNHLRNIGWMLNSHAISGGGENLHICDNVIEDFNYSAIAVGSSTPNDKAGKLTYIIERNEIRLTGEYTDDYLKNTLADGGGIYTGPQCTWGIIRNNVIDNIKGIHSNRGIFLDDGAKNLAIYDNHISNTANCYDIDLRYTKNYETGIPDHNTNNVMFDNVLTGGYRFEDGGTNSRCIAGENVQLGTGPFQNTVLKVHK